jgi:hypothetical protein
MYMIEGETGEILLYAFDTHGQFEFWKDPAMMALP